MMSRSLYRFDIHNNFSRIGKIDDGELALKIDYFTCQTFGHRFIGIKN